MAEKNKESITTFFGQNVRKYRKAAGLTQEQLSERLDISQKHLSIIETGNQFASAPLIERISEELNVFPGDLFGGSNDEIKKELREMQGTIISVFMNEITHKFSHIDATLQDLKQLLEEKLSS